MDSYPKETFPASAVVLTIRNPKGFMDRVLAEFAYYSILSETLNAIKDTTGIRHLRHSLKTLIPATNDAFGLVNRS